MAFARDLLNFLHANKGEYGYYFQSSDFPAQDEITSNEDELVYITRGGDPDEVDWAPNTTKIGLIERNTRDLDCPLLIIVWARHNNANTQKVINDIYRGSLTIGNELSYTLKHVHPNGLHSVEINIADLVEGPNYNYIVRHIDEL